MVPRMSGFLNCWFFCSVAALVCSNLVLAEDWVDPDLLAFEVSGSTNKGGIPNLEHCQNELSVCKKLKGLKIDGSAAQHIIEEMSLVVGNWMFLAGMQNLELPAGDRKSVPLMLTLTDMDLKTIKTYLNQPNYNSFMSAVPILNRIFSLNNVKNNMNLLEFNADNGETILDRKEKWVQIIFNVIMSCMNKETMLVLTCLIMGFVILKAMIFGADIRMLIGLFMVGVFFAGFLWNWAYMYQKAVVDQYVRRVKYQKYASSCVPDDSFWGFVKTLFGYVASTDECTEYFRGVQIDPLIMVPPTLALSETLSMFVIHPSLLIAEAMQKISRILFGNMVGGMYFGVPLVMLVFGTFFMMSFILLTGRRLRLKLIYLGSIEVGSQFENYWQPALSPGQREIQNVEPRSLSNSNNSSSQNASDSATNHNSSSNIPITTNGTDQNASGTNNSNASQSGLSDGIQPVNPHSLNQGATSLTSCCGVFSQPACVRHSVMYGCGTNPLFSRCSMTEPRLPEQSPENIQIQGGIFPEECLASQNPMYEYLSGNSVRSRRQRPLRNVTAKWTNENLRYLTNQWTNKNQIEMEEIVYKRRRKMSW